MEFLIRDPPARVRTLRRLVVSAKNYIGPGVWTAYLCFCLLVQATTGAWRADFSEYPDEPSHFVGAAMVRTWLMSGHWFTPLSFARDYYRHFPYFAVGYWPPAFHLAAGALMTITGVGRVQALFLPAACASVTALLIFLILRPRAGIVVAFCTGILYLAVPASQTWVCAVMVDQMTACLGLASAFFTFGYFASPGYKKGLCAGIVSAAAILSKYSAAYILLLPWALLVVFKRKELLCRGSFWAQPAIVAVVVAPWIFWTRTLAFYGIPAGRPALTFTRLMSFVAETFRIFPVPLLVVIVLGLAILIFRPPVREMDLTGIGLMVILHVGFLFISPVFPEQRYLLLPAAGLLVLSVVGWVGCLRWLGAGFNEGRGSILIIVFTLVFVSAYFGRYPKPATSQVAEIVRAVLQNTKTDGERRFGVPPDMEGAFIAEFVAQENGRPRDYVMRSTKVFANVGWFGENYSLTFASPEEIMNYFRQNPVTLIIWHDRAASIQMPHERLMSAMFRRYPQNWEPTSVPVSRNEPLSSQWTLYRYVPPHNSQ